MIWGFDPPDGELCRSHHAFCDLGDASLVRFGGIPQCQPARLDMTEHEQIEAQLKECERKFLNALQECPLAVTLTSAIDHRYIEVNNTFD
jgi:hypothetical protein